MGKFFKSTFVIWFCLFALAMLAGRHFITSSLSIPEFNQPLMPFMALMSASVADAFKHNRARKNVIFGSGLIMVCITLLSCVSSFMIFSEGFSDLPTFGQWGLSLAAVLTVEGAFCWMLYGFSRAFSTFAERVLALIGLGFLVAVMATNIITHFMIVKKIPLNSFQHNWISWAAPTVFIVVLIVVILISLCEPVAQLLRQENRIMGRQHEVLLQARDEAIDSNDVKKALGAAALIEGRALGQQIIEMAEERALLSSGSSPSKRFAPTHPASNFRRPPAPPRKK